MTQSTFMGKFAKKRIKIGKKSYTIIELIITVTIVAVVLLIGFVVYSQFMKTSRDAKRKADLESIKGVLEIFKHNNEYSSYPRSLTSLAGEAGLVKELPKDPKTNITLNDQNNYQPIPLGCSDTDPENSCSSYSLKINLESENGATYEMTPNYSGIVSPTPVVTGGTTPTSAPTNIPTPTLTPTPTTIVSSPTPTLTPTPTTIVSSPTPTLTPTNSPISTNTPTPTNTPTLIPTPTPTLLPVGVACTGSSRCQSNVCCTDSDGDGHCDKLLCSTGTCQVAGTPCDDCCDSDNRAYPGQASYYYTQRVGNGGTNCLGLAYDFNCDNSETKDPLTACVSTLTVGCYGTIPAGHPGYVSIIPACGVLGNVRRCYTTSQTACAGSTGIAYHYCYQTCPAVPSGGSVKVEDINFYRWQPCR